MPSTEASSALSLRSRSGIDESRPGLLANSFVQAFGKFPGRVLNASDYLVSTGDLCWRCAAYPA